MNQQYLIPANSKKSMLIFSMFRGIDLLILGIGAVMTLILLFAIPDTSLKESIIKLLPVAFSCFLVLPLPNYHNVMVFIREIINFFMNRRIYLWKGWCITSETNDEK